MQTPLVISINSLSPPAKATVVPWQEEQLMEKSRCSIRVTQEIDHLNLFQMTDDLQVGSHSGRAGPDPSSDISSVQFDCLATRSDIWWHSRD